MSIAQIYSNYFVNNSLHCTLLDRLLLSAHNITFTQDGKLDFFFFIDLSQKELRDKHQKDDSLY